MDVEVISSVDNVRRLAIGAASRQGLDGDEILQAEEKMSNCVLKYLES